MTEEEQGSDRRFPVLGIFLIFVALAVVGLSILIGSEGGPKHEQFDWTLASVFGTALGTTLLAVAMGGLAWSTRSEVRATQKLADLTKHDQDTRERPIVIQQAANVIPSQSRINVQLVNVGLGPALRVKVFATYLDAKDQPVFETETVTLPTLAPNESKNFDIPIAVEVPEPVRFDGFPLSGSCLDRSRENEYPTITSWSGPEGAT